MEEGDEEHATRGGLAELAAAPRRCNKITYRVLHDQRKRVKHIQHGVTAAPSQHLDKIYHVYQHRITRLRPRAVPRVPLHKTERLDRSVGHIIC